MRLSVCLINACAQNGADACAQKGANANLLFSLRGRRNSVLNIEYISYELRITLYTMTEGGPVSRSATSACEKGGNAAAFFKPNGLKTVRRVQSKDEEGNDRIGQETS